MKSLGDTTWGKIPAEFEALRHDKHSEVGGEVAYAAGGGWFFVGFFG